ncbi:MAG: patatin family protein [Oliverpabstia sp.]
MKTGLILEGGAMRGLFTAGVIDVLMENAVRFDGIIGVSAGAAFGCNYKSGQIGRVVRYNTKYCKDKRYCGISSLLKTGNIYNTDFCYGEVPLNLDAFDFDAYGKNPAEFYVVCTDIEDGKAVYHKYTGWEDHGFDWIRASASMPLVSQIVEIDGQKLLDGGISDSIPVQFFSGMGYTRNVVVLTQPEGYRKEKNHALAFIRRKYRNYPNLVKAMENRHVMYNGELDYISEEEASGRLFVIRPEAALPVSRVEKKPERLQSAYELGRKTAEKRLSELIRFLDKEDNK